MNNNKEGSDIFIYLFLILVVVVLVLLACYKKGYLSDDTKIGGTISNIMNDKKDNNSQTPSKKVTNTSTSTTDDVSIKYEGKEITDQNLKNDLSIKASRILSDGFVSDSEDYIYFGPAYNYDIINKKDDDKLIIALNSNIEQFRNINSSELEKMDKEIYDEYTIEDSSSTTGFINYADELEILEGNIISQTYKELFGENISNKDLGRCPYYYYDKKNNVYYMSTACGGTHYPLYLVYKNKYTIKDKKAYVYFSIATFHGDENYDKIYKGIGTNKDKLLYIKELTYNNEKYKFEIEEEVSTNYKKYEQYRMTFKLTQDGKYVYESIEKI